MANPIIERAVYNTKRWKKFRRAYFASKNGICEICGAPGEVVHHIEELTLDNYLDPFVVYAEENVQLVCWSCHEKTKTKSGIPIRADIAFDADGNVVRTGKRAPMLTDGIPPYSHPRPP